MIVGYLHTDNIPPVIWTPARRSVHMVRRTAEPASVSVSINDSTIHISFGLFFRFMCSIRIWGYCILLFYTYSFRSCDNIGQSGNSKVALIGSKNECMPWYYSSTQIWFEIFYRKFRCLSWLTPCILIGFNDLPIQLPCWGVTVIGSPYTFTAVLQFTYPSNIWQRYSLFKFKNLNEYIFF